MASPDWVIKPASAQIHKQWLEAFEQEPDLMSEEKKRLKKRPIERGENPRRTHKLRGKLAKRRIESTTYEQWQHEITSAGRIWYCVDRKDRIVWITQVSLSHPKKTE